MNRAKLLRRLAVATVALLYTWISGPPSAQADTETWNIESSYPYQVQLKFYSQDRNAVWPSASRAYLLDDSRVHKFSLECRGGERICYGAWDVTDRGSGSRYWGVGQNDRHNCTGCCWTCGRTGDPRTINLTR